MAVVLPRVAENAKNKMEVCSRTSRHVFLNPRYGWKSGS
jgi:hypothetical protein